MKNVLVQAKVFAFKPIAKLFIQLLSTLITSETLTFLFTTDVIFMGQFSHLI